MHLKFLMDKWHKYFYLIIWKRKFLSQIKLVPTQLLWLWKFMQSKIINDNNPQSLNKDENLCSGL